MTKGIRRKVKETLGRKLSIAISLLALVLVGVAVGFSYSIFSSQVFKNYRDLSINTASLADEYIDNDKIGTYLETMQEDAAYEETLANLFRIRDNSKVRWLYVEKVDEEKATYIMDADNTAEGCKLGDAFPLADEFRKSLPDVLAGNHVEPKITNGEFGWLMTYCQPLLDSQGSVAAHVCVDTSMSDIVNDRARFLILLAAVMLGISILFVSLYLLYIRRHVVVPINQVSEAAQDFVTEKEKAAEGATGISKLDIHTGDEIEELSTSIQSMEKDINAYIDSLTRLTVEKERMGAELDVAREIQSNLLPCIFPPYPERTDIDIFASMNTAKAVGGDFYDFFLIDDHTLAVLIADVSGKGIPAALFMMIAKTLIKNYAMMGKTPAQVFDTVNNALCENNEAGMFVTAFMAVLDLDSGKVNFANAGHNKPLLRSTDGAYHWLESRPGFVLAGMENIRYKEFSGEMHNGDQIFLYTDGVTEAVNPKEELYSDERLITTLNLPEIRELTPEKLLEYISQDVTVFADGADQADDITMLSVRFIGN